MVSKKNLHEQSKMGQEHVTNAWRLPALVDLWDLVIEVLHSSSNQPKKFKENVHGKPAA